MISDTFRDWCNKRKFFPSIFLVRNTAVGVFEISNVETEMVASLEPIEELILSVMTMFESITRIEASVVSGLSVEHCNDILEQLQKQRLIKLVTYDSERLHSNLAILIDEVDEDWKTDSISKLIKRKLLKQYQLTIQGKSAVKNKKKTITEIMDYNIIITSNPPNLFFDNVRLKHQGFEEITMNSDLTYQVLTFAKSQKDYTGVFPQKISPNAVASGKEIVNAAYWLGMELKNGKSLVDTKKMLFLSSYVFDRWLTPTWTNNLNEQLPNYKSIDELMASTLASNFEMVDEVITEGLKLSKDRMTWNLTTDLEMLMLINNIKPKIIGEISEEVQLSIQNSSWQLVIKLYLKPEDDLADEGLKAARFHYNVPRSGFKLSKGFKLWRKIMEEWQQDINFDEYLNILNLLVENDCLIEILPKIETLIIDVNNLVSFNLRKKQKWNFNRIRQIDDILEKIKIKNIEYFISSEFLNNIDEYEEAELWIQENNIEVQNTINTSVDIFNLVKESDGHYLGNQNIPSSDDYKELRRNSKRIKVFFNRNTISIPRLEKFYEFKVGNILEKLYDVYYE